MKQPSVRKATLADLQRIKELLTEASLPVLGVEEHLHSYLVAERDGSVIGSVGLELYDDTALLRSAVVTPEEQGKGIGSLLYSEIYKLARQSNVNRLLLLTNTAEEYFRRKGFTKIDQKSVTGPVTSSVEFTGACPSHAVCMELWMNGKTPAKKTEESLS